jgi:hypothetical protein
MKIKKGWIKHYRRDLEDLKNLTDQEYRYYMTSCLLAVWDKRNKHFGTFDARTKIIKQEVLPNWSMGKINTVKNSLIKKGYYKKFPEHRLKISNAKDLFDKSKESEYLIQDSEHNIHLSENDFQDAENEIGDIQKIFSSLANSKTIKYSAE